MMGVALLFFATIAWAGGALVLGDAWKQYENVCIALLTVAGTLLIVLGTMLVAELVSGMPVL